MLLSLHYFWPARFPQKARVPLFTTRLHVSSHRVHSRDWASLQQPHCEPSSCLLPFAGRSPGMSFLSPEAKPLSVICECFVLLLGNFTSLKKMQGTTRIKSPREIQHTFPHLGQCDVAYLYGFICRLQTSQYAFEW